MSLERANELAAAGRLLDAEDIFWSEIERGNVSARLSLAYTFHDAGLTSLALEHYLELKGTEYWESAAPQAAEIFLDVHMYTRARECLDGLSIEISGDSLETIRSVEEKTAGYIEEVPEIVEDLLSQEQQALQLLAKEAHLPTQLDLLQIREFLAHYSTVLATEFGKVIKDQAIQVSLGLVVSRKLSDAIGFPSRRWFEAAHATVNAFTLLNELDPANSEDFEKLALSAMGLIEKKYVISGRALSEDGEDFVINNLMWALNQLDHPAKDFYSHLMPQ